MRILYCNKYNFRFSGTEAYLFDVINALRSEGHTTALFSMSDPRGEPTAYDNHLAPPVDFNAKAGLFSKARLAGRAIYSSVARARLRGLLATFRPDVAHVRNIYHHLSPSILWELKTQGIPVLYHINDFKLLCPAYNLVSPSGDICERCAGGRFRNAVVCGCHAQGRAAAGVLAVEAYFHRWMKTYETCVDLVLAPSRFVRDKFIEHGWDKTRIEVLPHFQTLPSQTVPHTGRSGYVLYFGRLSPEKGVQDLISAMTQLPQIRLVIAGDGPQRPELEARAASLGLRNVYFAGHLAGEVLERAIAESQFTVFPSRAYETFGKSILESFAHGRAVIASDLGSRRELISNGETGLLYRAKDVAGLAAAIRFLSDRPDVAKAMGEAGRALVRARYTRDEHLVALTQIYERLASKPSRHKITHPRPLRVAFIGGRGVVGKYSGIETWYEQVGARLASQGHEVTVYCRRYFTPDVASHNGMRIIRLAAIRTKHLETFAHTFLSTIHACFSKCEIVHYQTLGPSLFARLPRLFGKRTVVTVQGLDWQRKKWRWPARQVLKAGEWASAHFANRTLVVSRELQEHFRARHRTETAYIPNGTDLRPRRSGLHLRQLGLAPDNYILFLGRLSPEKNCDVLINAFEGLTTNMKLVFAGGSSHSDDYVSRLRQHRSERIVFTDWLQGDALDEILTNAAVFVLPSDIEGMSLALLDAMGAGVCVLASDIPANREAIADAGFVFRHGDVCDLRRMLGLLTLRPDLRYSAAEKARARVRDNYLWDDVATQMEKTYQNLVGRRQAERLISHTTAAA